MAQDFLGIKSSTFKGTKSQSIPKIKIDKVKQNNKSVKTPKFEPKVPITTPTEFFLPNHSGDHSAGKTGTPINDLDIANKKYVDDTAGGDHTASSTDSLTNKTIDSFTNQVEADEIHIQIRNESGSTMTKGQLVYISGYNVGLDRTLVSLADSSSSSTMPMLAMINDSDILNNASGHATVSGRVFDIDTSAFSVGDSVYVSTTPGLLSTRPAGTTDQVQRIGIVLRSQANNGVIQLIGAGRVNDIPNDIDHTTDIQNVGTNTHAQIDTSITATGLNTTHRGSDGSDHSLSHAESHTIVSHSDTTGTGAELNTLTGGGETTLHSHAGGGDWILIKSGQGTTTSTSLTDIDTHAFSASDLNDEDMIFVSVQTEGGNAGRWQVVLDGAGTDHNIGEYGSDNGSGIMFIRGKFATNYTETVVTKVERNETFADAVTDTWITTDGWGQTLSGAWTIRGKARVTTSGLTSFAWKVWRMKGA